DVRGCNRRIGSSRGCGRRVLVVRQRRRRSRRRHQEDQNGREEQRKEAIHKMHLLLAATIVIASLPRDPLLQSRPFLRTRSTRGVRAHISLPSWQRRTGRPPLRESQTRRGVFTTVLSRDATTAQ